MEVRKDLTNGMSVETIRHHHAQFEVLSSQKSGVAAKIGQRKKLAEADGFEIEGYKLGVKLGKKDPAEAVKVLNFAILTVQACYPDVGRQLTLFGEPTPVSDMTPDQLNQMWFDQGYKAGLSGADATTCTYAASTPAFQRWMSGWRDGNAFYVDGLKQVEQDGAVGAAVAEPSQPFAPVGGFGASGGVDSYDPSKDGGAPAPAAEAAPSEEGPKKRGRKPGKKAEAEPAAPVAAAPEPDADDLRDPFSDEPEMPPPGVVGKPVPKLFAVN